MKTCVLRPISDVNQLWTQFPNDGQSFYLKIDESAYANDGDATRIETSQNALVQIFGVGPFPHDFKQSVAIRIHAWAKSTVAANLGFIISVNGVNYPLNDAGFDFSSLPLNQWDELFATTTGLPVLLGTETLQLILVSAPSPGTVGLTAWEMEIDYVEKAPRPSASGGAVEGSASASGGSSAGSAQGVLPAASAASMAIPDAAAVAVVGSVSALPLAGNSIAQALAASGLASDPGKPLAFPAPTCPTATPSSTSPSATGAAFPTAGDTA